MKKTTKRTKRALTAVLAGAMMMSTVAAMSASAYKRLDIHDHYFESESWRSAESAHIDYVKEMRTRDLDLMRKTVKTVTISNDGMYHAKGVKLYGRRILSVNDKAEYVLGGWEQLNPNTSMHGLTSDTFNIGADYAQFAFSFDITWGTDFPFSGIFWDKTYTTNWNELDITMNGTCRSANLYIAIGGKRYKSVQDCYSHKEWRP